MRTPSWRLLVVLAEHPRSSRTGRGRARRWRRRRRGSDEEGESVKKRRTSLLLPSDGEGTADLALQSSGETNHGRNGGVVSSNETVGANKKLIEDAGMNPKGPVKFSGETHSGLVVLGAEGAVGGKGGLSAANSEKTKEDRLVQLVRNYCSLLQERRANSNEAEEIESLSGYPLPGKAHPVADSSTTKEEFLLRVKPIVQEMENRKQMDAAEAKVATQCEAKKNGFDI